MFIWLLGYLYLYLCVYIFIYNCISVFIAISYLYLSLCLYSYVFISVCLVDLESLHNSGKFILKIKIIGSVYISKYLPK